MYLFKYSCALVWSIPPFSTTMSVSALSTSFAINLASLKFDKMQEVRTIVYTVTDKH